MANTDGVTDAVDLKRDHERFCRIVGPRLEREDALYGPKVLDNMCPDRIAFNDIAAFRRRYADDNMRAQLLDQLERDERIAKNVASEQLQDLFDALPAIKKRCSTGQECDSGIFSREFEPTTSFSQSIAEEDSSTTHYRNRPR